MKVFISDIIVKKDKYGPDYYWIVGQLDSGMKLIIEDVNFDLRKYIGYQVDMLLSFMRSPYLESKMGIHNTSFIAEKYYSIELIDELINTEGVIPNGEEDVIILAGEYIENYHIPEKWKVLIQRSSFKAFFNDPSALKTKDGTFLLSPFHSKRRAPLEKKSQKVIMAGSLRLEAWCLINEDFMIIDLHDKMDYVKIKDGRKIYVDFERLSLDLNALRINKIGDIIGLQDLHFLRRLELQGNRLASVEGLENLMNLEELFLSGNKISKIEGLNKLPHLKSYIWVIIKLLQFMVLKG